MIIITRLCPGVGVAVQVILYGNNVLYPADMVCTNTVQRMYFANYFTNSTVTGPTNSIPHLQTNLQVSLQGTSVVLNWDTFTNSTNYEVDFTHFYHQQAGSRWELLRAMPGRIQ